MYTLFLSLLAVLGVVTARQGVYKGGGSCPAFNTIDWSLRTQFCNQPIFVTLLPKDEESELIDNICITYFPLPDDPDTFTLYYSRVFCDGSTQIETYIATQVETGVIRRANPYETVSDITFGYAGCDTYLDFICINHGAVGYQSSTIGLSPSCRPVGLSCLRKIEEIIQENCLPDVDFFALPMKLPNRCVTEQLCLNQSNQNQFYKALGFTGPLYNSYVY